ncbi:MAG: thioester reductase domain-containing protein, partial [Streptomycetaceae bacterium]|nr:thioester reductase domain-containing protein [Streptomycetaceae bacterium]
TVLCGGEAMPPDLAEALLDRAGAVWNMYGPTETTIWSTVDRIRRAAPVTLGTPIANTVCAVLDDESRPLPVGVPGELCIGGDGVAHGYWNRPDLTADRFRETPLGRLYRTGDVVRLNHDGRLEFGGRADHQVKIRGFRIELGEIDAALTACPGIGQAVTVVRADGTGEPRLVAYVTGTATIELKDVKSRLGRRLPDYMVPATIHVLDRMPLTLNGKIDRKALPEPSGEASGRAARTPAEETWCAVFAAALGVAHVGADQNLFALGGTSLTVTRVVATARDAGLAVTVRQVLAAPTPAALAGTRPAAVRTDLAAEVTLAPDIAPPPRHTLLTGATGFLGAFLLRDLSTHDIVTCLVRAHSPEYAWRRLRDATARYGLTVDERRLRVVPGDLARPHFGLGPDGFAELGAAVDRIVHCGATVNWLPSYADLKPVNVTGTEQVLRLAAARRLPVHHVSSMGVYAQRRPGVPRHTADTPTGPPADLITGYQQSKWVAEGLVGLARERGLPVSVYRVGRIGGDSRTGACQTDDYLWRILRGSVEAGIVPPAPGLAYDLSAVDHVSAAIVALADRHIGGDHHLAAPAPVRFDDLVTAVRAAGHPLTEVDPDKWADVVGSDPDNAAYMLADDFRATLRDPSRTEIALDPTETDVLLRRLGIESPPVDVAATIAHFQRTGFFPRVREDG